MNIKLIELIKFDTVKTHFRRKGLILIAKYINIPLSKVEFERILKWYDVYQNESQPSLIDKGLADSFKHHLNDCMARTCLSCNAVFYGEVCEICCEPEADFVEEIEEYKGYKIKKYSSEIGYRVDFGTKRSKLVITVEEARELVDF